jgi:TRAP-type mannitol/chloroaromatic compound transport system permease small subunit
VNLLGTLLLLVPFCVMMIWASWPFVIESWSIQEASPDPGGLPRYPLKTFVPVAFALVLLQGLALALRQVAVLRGHLPPEEDAEGAHDHSEEKR